MTFTCPETQHPYSYQELIQPGTESKVRFNRISSGSDFGDAVYLHSSGPDAFYGATIQVKLQQQFRRCLELEAEGRDNIVVPDSDSVPNYRLATPIGITDRYGQCDCVKP